MCIRDSYYPDHLTFLTNANTSIMDPSGFYKAVRDMPTINVQRYGDGMAVLMNLSPQFYNAYRCMSAAGAAASRAVFMEAVHDTGIGRWIEIEAAGADEHGYEITYWLKDGRTIVMLVLNPEDLVNSSVVGLRTETLPITLTFYEAVADLRDERTGAVLGAGDSFDLTWTTNEALVLSFLGAPPAGPRPGDANFDGCVDGLDYIGWTNHYGQDGGWLSGDFSRNNHIDGLDYVVWSNNYWAGCPGLPGPVPEPTGLLLIALGGVTLFRRRT